MASFFIPPVKTHDSSCAFIEHTPLIIFNTRPFSHLLHSSSSFHHPNLRVFHFTHLLSSSPFKCVFSSAEPTPLPIFVSLSIFSTHLHRFISWIHCIFLFSTLFTFISFSFTFLFFPTPLLSSFSHFSLLLFIRALTFYLFSTLIFSSSSLFVSLPYLSVP